jgi:hypothetical protein
MKMTPGSVAWEGVIEQLEKVLRGWTPNDEPSELKYRDSLAKHLRECAPNARIETEYRTAGTTVDIYFKWNGLIFDDHILFELKRNLKDKSTFDRLVGQIEGLKPRDNTIFVVLCGETKPDLLDRLRERYKQYLSGGTLMDSGKMRIIEKKVSKTAKAG